jgi:predicted secreted protein
MHPGRLGILLLAGALLGGCAAGATSTPAATSTPTAPQDVLTISCDDFAAGGQGGGSTQVERSVTVAPGESFRITLCSNPSTGFSWEDPVISGSADVSIVDHQVSPASGSTAGAAGSELFTFRAGSAGTATIDFAYSRPWEGGEKGTWKATVSVDAT